MTGGKVDILSRKNHFELDREIKQDIAAGTIDWCVGSNHTSFAPQYGNIYIDLNGIIPAETLAEFDTLAVENSTVEGRLVQLPRHSDVSNLYYKKSLYADQANKDAFKAKHNYDLMPPETWLSSRIRRYSLPMLQSSTVPNMSARTKQSPAGSTNFWWLKAVRCLTTIGTPHSILKPAFAPSCGSRTFMMQRPFPRAC